MTSFRTRLRLRLQLLLVAIVAVAPVMAAVGVNQRQAREQARLRTLADSLRLVRLAATQQASILNGARLLLLTLNEFAPLRAADPRECLEVLPRVLRDHSGYLALTVANADGTIFCSSGPAERLAGADATGRVWFTRVMRSRAMAIGDYQVSAVTGQPAIVVAHPLLDAAGGVSRIVVAMIDLTRSSSVMSGADLPPGATLTLFDRSGTILARFPDGDSWLGHRIPDEGPLQRLRTGAAEDMSDGLGVDGIRRLYVTVPVRGAIDTGLYAGIGIDYDAAFSESDRNYRSYLWLLAIVSLTGLGAAVIAGHLFVLKPMRALKAVTERIAAGDLSARAQLADTVAGVSELGGAVNAMAGALDTREQAREHAERELRASEDRYRLLFAQNPHPMWVYDAETLDFLEVNDAAVKHYGYSRAEFLAMRITDIRPTGEVPRLMALIATGRLALMESVDWRHRLSSGALIDVQVTSHTLPFAGRPAVVVTAQDVTVRRSAEAALVERAALTTVSSEVGAALNRPCDLLAGMQSCAEAIVAHLDVVAARITIAPYAGGDRELAATAGAPAGEAPGDGLTVVEWPLSVGDRTVGALTVYARTDLSEGTLAGLTSAAAMIALGITRHQSEHARRLLAEIVASSDEAIYGTMADGTIVSWNAGAERIFGYSREAILGRNVALLYPPDRRDDLPALMARINRGESIMHLETIRQRRDDSLVAVSLSLSPIRDAANRVMGTSAIARDITERQHTEQRLRLLARALESTNEMVSVTDTQDRFTFVNAAFLRAYCYTAEQVIGQTPALLQSAATPRSVIADILRQSRGDGWTGELLNRRSDGTEFVVSLNTSAVRDDRGDIIGLLGVARDITEQRSLENQLRQSQKMDAVGQLAGGIAHDFNNLLTVIQGCVGFLAEGLPPGGEQQADVEEIRRAAERAADLTRQLLAFSRKQILAVRVLHVGDIVGDVTPMLRRLIGETIDLRTLVGNRGLVKTDPGQLQQVIVNLAVNARDAMPHGGRLTVETADVMLDDAFARLHPSTRPGPHVRLVVTDSGHGMDAATQKRIFEPFFTTKPVGQGTGLGLATVYGIVKQSGGSVWVESEVGTGTTFTVYFPTTDDAEAVDPLAVAETRAPGGTETVLLIEDEGPVREFVYRVLSRRGYTVHAVASPLKALDYAKAHAAPIDLVFSDVVLPNMTGRAAVTQIQQWHPESAVLFMSGYTDGAIVHEGVLDAGTAFLPKPFTADALTRKVRDVLDARGPQAPIAKGAGDRSSGTASGG